MNRFGSSKLRIVWACVSLLLVGLVLTGVRGISPDGSQLVVFGTGIPMGFDVKPYVAENLQRLGYTTVYAVILSGGFIPLGEWMNSGSLGERFKALSLGILLAFLHGLFLSQIAILPVLATGYRVMGNFADPLLLRADLNACLLGLQLLLWTAFLGQVIKSNRGLAVLFSLVLLALGKVLSWCGEFGSDLDWPRGLVATFAVLGKLLPTEKLPSDPLALTSLPLCLGGPIILTAIMLMLPSKVTGKAKA